MSVELRKIGQDELFFTGAGPATWEPHPDGKGGYRPIDPSERGDVNIPCPHCGGALVRDGTDDLIRRTVFGCGTCHRASVGAKD